MPFELNKQSQNRKDFRTVGIKKHAMAGKGNNYHVNVNSSKSNVRSPNKKSTNSGNPAHPGALYTKNAPKIKKYKNTYSTHKPIKNSRKPNKVSKKSHYEPMMYDLPQLGLGDWIKDNKKGIIGGLKTIGGAAAMFVPGLQSVGTGLIGSGVGDIAQEVQQDKAVADQEAAIRQQKQTQTIQSNYQNLMNQVDPTTVQEENQALAEGGFIEYDGQTHSGPDGGIPVDVQGNPSGNPVALTEDGEVTYFNNKMPQPYVFSNKVKFDKNKTFADKAKTIKNKYKLRLGNKLNKIDPISRKGLDYEMSNLMFQQESLNSNKESQDDTTPELKCGGKLKKMAGDQPGNVIPDVTYQQEVTFEPWMMEPFDTNIFSGYDPSIPSDTITSSPIAYDANMNYEPYDTLKENLPYIGLQAGLSTIGNLVGMSRDMPEYEPYEPATVAAEEVSYAPERLSARNRSDRTMRNLSRIARNAGLSRNAFISQLGAGLTNLNTTTGDLMGRSYQNEANTNVQNRMRARLANMQARNQARYANARLKYMADADKYNTRGQYLSGLTQGLQGAVGDIQKTISDRDFMNMFSSRVGYQPMTNTATGDLELRPLQNFWNKR